MCFTSKTHEIAPKQKAGYAQAFCLGLYYINIIQPKLMHTDLAAVRCIAYT